MDAGLDAGVDFRAHEKNQPIQQDDHEQGANHSHDPKLCLVLHISPFELGWLLFPEDRGHAAMLHSLR